MEDFSSYFGRVRPVGDDGPGSLLRIQRILLVMLDVHFIAVVSQTYRNVPVTIRNITMKAKISCLGGVNRTPERAQVLDRRNWCKQ